MRSPTMPLCLLLAAACAPTGDAPLTESPVTQAAVTSGLPLTLQEPRAGGVVRQNNPTLGCPVDAQRGYGFRVGFDWTDDPAGGVAYYEILATRTGAPIPALHTTSPSSGYTWRSCNTYVADLNLDGWSWQVRTFYLDGSSSGWTTPGAFRFNECRLAGGAPCLAAPASPQGTAPDASGVEGPAQDA